MAKCSNDPLNMITPNQALRTQHRHSCYYSAHWPTINQSLRLHRRRLRDWTWWNMAARLLFLDGKNAGVSESRVHLAVLHCDLIWTIMIHHQRSSLCLNKAQSGNSSTKKLRMQLILVDIIQRAALNNKDQWCVLSFKNEKSVWALCECSTYTIYIYSLSNKNTNNI